jgi:hypothetical protein
MYTRPTRVRTQTGIIGWPPITAEEGQQYTKNANAQIQAFNHDVQTQLTRPSNVNEVEYIRGWNVWLDNWNQYYKSATCSEGLPLCLLPDGEIAISTVKTYEFQLAEWKTKFQALGHKVNAPSVPDSTDMNGVGGVPWSMVVLVAGLFGAAYLIKQVKSK